jgi:hypothetical protein
MRIARRPSPVVLDDNLADPAWQAAEVIGRFKQRDPNEGGPASQRIFGSSHDTAPWTR